MKTAIYLMFTSLISAGSVFGATTMEKPAPAVLIAATAWLLFFWGQYRRSRKAAQRRFQEDMFQQHMRSILHNPRY